MPLTEFRILHYTSNPNRSTQPILYSDSLIPYRDLIPKSRATSCRNPVTINQGATVLFLKSILTLAVFVT